MHKLARAKFQNSFCHSFDVLIYIVEKMIAFPLAVHLCCFIINFSAVLVVEKVAFADMSQLVRLWYYRIRAVSPEPSLFAHMKNVSRRRTYQNQTSSPLRWLCMHVRKIILRRTKTTIISWDGSCSVFDNRFPARTKTITGILMYTMSLACFLQHTSWPTKNQIG